MNSDLPFPSSLKLLITIWPVTLQFNHIVTTALGVNVQVTLSKATLDSISIRFSHYKILEGRDRIVPQSSFLLEPIPTF
jgi:hypothetical protein